LQAPPVAVRVGRPGRHTQQRAVEHLNKSLSLADKPTYGNGTATAASRVVLWCSPCTALRRNHLLLLLSLPRRWCG